jgi:hypothetical protein
MKSAKQRSLAWCSLSLNRRRGEDERTGRDEWCSEHRQHRLRIRERAWRMHSAHDPCFDHGRSVANAKEPRRGGK